MTVQDVLTRLLPSIEDLDELLSRVRKKYDLPDLTIADRETIEAVKVDAKYDWDAIQQDVEKGLIERIDTVLVETGLNKWLELSRAILDNSQVIKVYLMSMGADVTEDASDKFVAALRMNAESVFDFMRKFYTLTSKRLVEHLKTGGPVDIPVDLINLVFKFQFPNNGEKLVVAIGLEYNDPDELADTLRNKMSEVFDYAPRFSERDVENAEYLAMKNRKVDLAEITRIDIARHPEVMKHSIDDPEYDDEFDNRKETLNRRMLRLQREINKVRTTEKDTDKT
jgi:hypothetical protein